MTSPLHYREATMLDLYRVLNDLRREDRAELATFGLHDPMNALGPFSASATSLTAVEREGELVGVYGVSPEPGMEGAGRAWALHREGQGAPSRAYLQDARRALDELSRGYLTLFNWKWVGNAHHLPWLQKLGFIPLRRIALRGHHYIEIVRPTP